MIAPGVPELPVNLEVPKVQPGVLDHVKEPCRAIPRRMALTNDRRHLLQITSVDILDALPHGAHPVCVGLPNLFMPGDGAKLGLAVACVLIAEDLMKEHP